LSGGYKNLHEIKEDYDLIASNCKTYNRDIIKKFELPLKTLENNVKKSVEKIE
jgi:hypothetical protein